MEVSVEGLVVSGWRKRQNAVDWGACVRRHWSERNLGSGELKLESERLCEFLVSQSLIGAVPSPLLLEYLHHAVLTCLVSPLTLMEKFSLRVHPSPTTGSQFKAYIDLAKLIAPDIFGKGREFEGLEGPKAVVELAVILAEGIRYFTDVLKFSFGEGGEDFLRQMDLGTFSNCVGLLHGLFSTERTLALMLVGREEFPSRWKVFQDMFKELGLLFVSNHAWEPPLSFRTVWFQLKDCLRVINKGLHPNLRNHVLSATTLLDLSVENQARSWLSLSFLIEEEFSGRISWSTEESADYFDMLRNAKGKSYRSLYSELWVSAWHSYQNSEESTKKQIKRNYLFVKVPMMIELWKERDADVSMEEQGFNNVELSIADLANFSSLTHSSDLMDSIIRVCIVRGLTSAARMQTLFPQKDIGKLSGVSLDSPASFDPLSDGAISKTLEDVQSLSDCIEKAAEMSFSTIVNCIIQSLTSQWAIQGQLVQLLLQVLNPRRGLPPCLVEIAISMITANKLVLDILNMHGTLPTLISHLVYWIDTWGTEAATVAHEYFGSAIVLLVLVLDSFEEVRLEKYDLEHSLSPSLIRWYHQHVNSIFSDQEHSDLGAELMSALFQSFSPADTVVEGFAGTHNPWSMMECIPFFLEQSCAACVSAKISVPSVVEVFVSLCKHMPYWAYFTLSWLCTELESGTWKTLSQATAFSERGLVHFEVFLALLESHSLQESMWKYFPSQRILAVMHQFHKSKQHIAKIESFLEKMPKAPGAMYVHPETASSNLSTNVHRYFFALMKDTLSLEPAAQHFKYVLSCFGKHKFCMLIVKEVMGTISEKATDVPKTHSLRAAELGGSIVGSCGKDVASELYSQIIPLCIPHLHLQTHGHILAHFAFYAGLRSGLLTSSQRDSLAPAVGDLFGYLVGILQRLCVAPTPALSFPLTFLSLVTAVPQTAYIIPPDSFVPLLHRMQSKSVDVLALLDFTQQRDRDFCNQFFSKRM